MIRLRQIKDFLKLLPFRITNIIRRPLKKKERRLNRFKTFVPAPSSFKPSEALTEAKDYYSYKGIFYVPTEENLKNGDTYHLKNLETGAIMVMNPKKNEAYLLKKDPLDKDYKKVWGSGVTNP